VPQWLARATDMLPSQAAARIGHGDAGLANPGDPPAVEQSSGDLSPPLPRANRVSRPILDLRP